MHVELDNARLLASIPRDRGVLLHLQSKYRNEPYERFAVARYAQWGDREVWETGPGECVALDESDIVGWSELPDYAGGSR